MANVSFQTPTDYQIEADDIARRRKYAEALQAQSMQSPETQMVGGWAIPNSPLQGVGRLAQALAARKGLESATARQKELGAQYNTERGAALAAALRAGQGTPAQTIQPDPQEAQQSADFGTPEVGAVQKPAVAGSRQAMIAALTGSRFPDLQAAGMAQSLKEMEPYTLSGDAKRLIGNTVIAANPKSHPLHFADTGTGIQPMNSMTGAPVGTATPKNEGTWGEPYEMNGAMVQRNPITGQVRQAVSREPQIHVNSPPPITAVTIADPNDPNKTIVIDGRTRQVLGAGPKLTATGGAEQKLSLGLPQAKLRVESMGQNLDRLDEALTTLDKDPGLTRITGTVMGRTPNVSNTATGAQAQLNSIKSQIFQSSLQAMREASKTGGAVGNVSDREGDKLERTLAALDQAQGTPDFKKQLQKAVAQVRLSKQLIQTAFDEQYGGVQGRNVSVPAPGGSGGLSPAEQAELDQLRGRFGKPK